MRSRRTPTIRVAIVLVIIVISSCSALLVAMFGEAGRRWAWAYVSTTQVVVMSGDTQIASIRRVTDTYFSHDQKTVWTEGREYLVFLDDTVIRQLPGRDRMLIAVESATGRSSEYPCPQCFDIVGADGSQVVVERLKEGSSKDITDPENIGSLQREEAEFLRLDVRTGIESRVEVPVIGPNRDAWRLAWASGEGLLLVGPYTREGGSQSLLFVDTQALTWVVRGPIEGVDLNGVSVDPQDSSVALVSIKGQNDICQRDSGAFLVPLSVASSSPTELAWATEKADGDAFHVLERQWVDHVGQHFTVLTGRCKAPLNSFKIGSWEAKGSAISPAEPSSTGPSPLQFITLPDGTIYSLVRQECGDAQALLGDATCGPATLIKSGGDSTTVAAEVLWIS